MKLRLVDELTKQWPGTDCCPERFAANQAASETLMYRQAVVQRISSARPDG
jgi:hypothetical protein